MGVLLLLTALVQSPADRASIESLRDSLAGVTDTVALHALEAATIAVAKERRNDPLIHIRLGFIGYRLGETTKTKSHYDDAAGEFEWAAELQNDWPYPWYGLGLAEVSIGESSSIAIENIRQMLGKDYLSKAARAFARAAEADPAFASAVVDLATTALTQRIHPRLQVALNAVRLAAAGPAGRHPDVQLVRGRVEREAGEGDSAIAAFTTYLAIGGDSGVGLLELARSYYFAHKPGQGWVAYFAGAHAATSAAALTLYRLDLSWIADSTELAAFDGLPNPDARQQWLERFWARRDAAEARDVGERLAEHYRRWFYARHNFRLVSRHRHYDMTEVYRAAQTEFDDRGVIYLRHGEPDKRAQFICQSTAEPNGEGCAANESWLYHRRDGDLIFHFAARDDVQDFKLVESLADVLGFNRAVRATTSIDPELAALYQTGDEFGPLYSRVARVQHALGPDLAPDRSTPASRACSTRQVPSWRRTGGSGDTTSSSGRGPTATRGNSSRCSTCRRASSWWGPTAPGRAVRRCTSSSPFPGSGCPSSRCRAAPACAIRSSFASSSRIRSATSSPVSTRCASSARGRRCAVPRISRAASPLRCRPVTTLNACSCGASARRAASAT